MFGQYSSVTAGCKDKRGGDGLPRQPHPRLATLRGRGGVGGIGVFDVFGGPDRVIALEPLADGALHADVVAGVTGAVPLVFENLVALLEEEWPEFGFGNVRKGVN